MSGQGLTSFDCSFTELWAYDCSNLKADFEDLVRRYQAEKMTMGEYERRKSGMAGNFKALYGTWAGEDVLAAEEARVMSRP